MFVRDPFAVKDGGYVLNGQAHGAFAQEMAQVGYDPGYMRPYYNEDGIPCVTINVSGKQKEVPIVEVMKKGIMPPVFNATTLRKEEWIEIDKVVVKATRQRLRAWTDLAAASSVRGVDPMTKTTYEYEAMSDPGEAMESMDGQSFGRNDTPVFALSSIPLPIQHVDFEMSQRRLGVSQNSGTPLNMTMFEAGARRIAERVERNVIGTVTGIHYGTVSTGPTAHRANSQVYGYTTFPQRQTKTDLTTPTGSNPMATVDDVLEMRELMYAAGFFGPFMLYHSTDWDVFLDDDYGQTNGSGWGFAPTKTLRNRLREIEGIQDIRRLDFLTATSNPYTLLLVQMTSEVAQALDLAQPKTQQWVSKGGWQLHFRIWGCQVPLLKYDYNENCGVVHATTS